MLSGIARALSRGKRIRSAVPCGLLLFTRLSVWMAACSCALVMLASGPTRAANAAGSDKTANLALYYGADLPIDELRAFDIVVVEPDHKINARAPTGAHTKFFAYVSVGEVLPSRDYYKRVDPTWKVGENRAWGSIVIDQSRPEWHRFFIEEVVRPLWQRGYRGLFLDTMDSYYLLADRDYFSATMKYSF